MTGAIVALAFLGGLVAILVCIVGGTWLLLPKGKVPGYGMLMSGCPYAPELVARAADLFLAGWAARFGPAQAEAVLRVLNRMSVVWEQTPFFDDYNGGEHSAGYMKWVGTTGFFFRGRVEIAWMPSLPMGKTALVHEWTHAALQVTVGDADRNHGAAPGPWTKEHAALIQEVNAAIMSFPETKAALGG